MENTNGDTRMAPEWLNESNVRWFKMCKKMVWTRTAPIDNGSMLLTKGNQNIFSILFGEKLEKH